MRKHLFKNSLSALALVFFGLTVSLFSPSMIYAQCPFLNTQYPSGNIASPTTLGQSVQVSTCSFGGEFASVTGFTANYTYTINIAGLATPYITVFDASNTAVASGNAPFAFIPTVSGNYKTQWTTSGPAGCGTDGSCHVTTVVLTAIGPPAPPTPTQDPTPPTCSAGTALSIAGTPGVNQTWYWQTSATGTSTATPYTGPYSVFANGTYFVRTFDSSTSSWSTAVSITVSNFPLASNPPTPTANANPACITTGATLSEAAAPVGYVYYWQGTTVGGTSTALNASATYNAPTSGTYYVSAYETATQCWSNTVGLAVTVDTYIPPAPIVAINPVNVCTGTPSVQLNATPSATSGTATITFGTNYTLNPGASVLTGNLTIPAGATITSSVLSFNGVSTSGSQWASDMSFNLTGASTYANTNFVGQVITNAGPFNYNTTTSPAGGTVNLNMNNSWSSNGTFGSITLTVNYSLPTPTMSWYDAASNGTNLGSGSPFEAVGTTVLPNTSTEGSFMFYAGTTVGGCISATRTAVTVNTTAVLAVLNPVNVTCNGGNNGSFTLGAVQCGSGTFTYAVDGGAAGAIPTNLTAGTYTVVIHDGAQVSAPITLIITEPAAPTALTATNVTYYNADLGWTTTGNETSWTVIYGPAGFDPSTGGTVVPTTTNPLEIVGDLTADTQYEFYVFATCGPQPDTAGPFAFTTDPGFYTYDNICGPAFVDISATGANLNLTDDSEAGVTLPWTWNINGTAVNTITVGNNGGVLFNTLAGNVGYTAFGNGFFPFVQDLNTAEPGGGVFWESVGVAPNRQLIIMWKDLSHYTFPAATDGSTFEMIVEESGDVYFVYQDVIFSNPIWDNGADAEIAAITPNGTVTVSSNSATYLASNQCAHFYNELCPNITTFTSLIFPDDAILDWNAGLYGETQWTLIYGPAGFDPTVAGQAIDTFDLVTSDASFGGTLTQLTEYDVYIYSECAADNLTSPGYFFNFTTLPYCSNPASIIANTDVDSLEAAWNWTASSIDYPILSYNIQYGPTGFNLYDGTIVAANGTNLADTIFDASFMGGGVYQVYVQAVCTDVVNGGTDTSAFSGPITFIMPLTTDTVCGAELLTVDGTVYTFNNTGATVSVDESNIAPPATGAQTTDGWANSTLNNTTWYKFIAPASGSVRVNATANTYNGQIGVYDVTNCADFNTNFDLVAANDNEIGGTSLAPNFTVCGLTPGNEYYIMHDGFSATTGNHTISITEIVLEAGATNPLTQICTGDDVNLFTTINGYDMGGAWSAPVAAVNASITDSTFTSTGLAYQTFTFQYRVTDGCAYDSITSQIQVFAPSSAGTDGSLTVCKNEMVDLLSGLGGTVQTGGTWYDPSNNVLPSSQITASAFPGSFNYDYIAGNGVCPDDTANVVVVVSPSCDINSIDETVFAGVSVYPNPSTGIIYVDADLAAGNFDYVVTDANGRVIAKATNGVKAASTSTIDLRGVETGVYFIRLSNQSSDKMFRIVVQ